MNQDNDADNAGEIEVEALELNIVQQPIELYKVLKIANAVAGGGEAKMAISEGYVAVNGEVEQRKRCKIYADDLIEFNGEYYYIVCDPAVSASAREAIIPSEGLPATKAGQAKSDNPASSKKDSKTGRKLIQF